MIVAIGRVRTDAQRREQLVRAGQALALASREEQGCISYQLCRDTENESDFVFVEEWQDQDALDKHFRTPHVAEFMRAIPAMLVAPPDVKFHTIASTVALADVSAP